MSVATIVAICSLGAKALAQDATPEQIAAEKLLAQQAQDAARESELKALEVYSKLSPKERELRELENELRMIKFEKEVKPIVTPPELLTLEERLAAKELRRQRLAMGLDSVAVQDEITTQTTQFANSEWTEQSLSFGSCGSDPNEFYNLPLFTATSGMEWQTEDEPTTWYPWMMLTPNGNDASGRAAATSGNFSANFSSSPLFVSITNNFDTYGVPLRHRLSFKYQFTKSNVNDIFRVQVGGNYFVTNLPTAASWTRITLNVPPFPRTTTTTEIRFTVFKNSALSSSPNADLYAPQWCTEVRSTNVVLAITRAGASNLISWSHETAPTNFWSLEFSTILGSGAVWSTNIGTAPVVYSNTTAVVSFPANNPQRYYRLKRNW